MNKLANSPIPERNGRAINDARKEYAKKTEVKNKTLYDIMVQKQSSNIIQDKYQRLNQDRSALKKPTKSANKHSF